MRNLYEKLFYCKWGTREVLISWFLHVYRRVSLPSWFFHKALGFLYSLYSIIVVVKVMRIRNSVIQTPGALEILTCIYFYENVCCVYFESCHFVIFVDCIDISKVLFLCSRNKSSKLSNIFHPFLGYFIHIRTESVHIYTLKLFFNCIYAHSPIIRWYFANWQIRWQSVIIVIPYLLK